MSAFAKALVALPAGVRLRVWVKPGSRSSTGITGCEDGAIVVRVSEPAREGRANNQVIRVLARRFQMAKSDISITQGLASKRKTIECRGIGYDSALAQLQHE